MHRITTTRIMVRFTTDSLIRFLTKNLLLSIHAGGSPADWALLANLPQEDTRNADYVWLPILFDGDNVKIEWRDSWKLEDYE